MSYSSQLIDAYATHLTRCINDGTTAFTFARFSQIHNQMEIMAAGPCFGSTGSIAPQLAYDPRSQPSNLPVGTTSISSAPTAGVKRCHPGEGALDGSSSSEVLVDETARRGAADTGTPRKRRKGAKPPLTPEQQRLVGNQAGRKAFSLSPEEKAKALALAKTKSKSCGGEK